MGEPKAVFPRFEPFPDHDQRGGCSPDPGCAFPHSREFAHGVSGRTWLFCSVFRSLPQCFSALLSNEFLHHLLNPLIIALQIMFATHIL